MDNCRNNNWSDSIIEKETMFTVDNMTRFVGLIFRLLILGVIVFGAITYLPANPANLRNRVLITLVIVTLYALIDVIVNMLAGMRRFLCNVACPPPQPDPIDFNLQSLDL